MTGGGGASRRELGKISLTCAPEQTSEGTGQGCLECTSCSRIGNSRAKALRWECGLEEGPEAPVVGAEALKSWQRLGLFSERGGEPA